MAKRCMHVPDEGVTEIANQVGGLMWPDPDGGSGDDDDGAAGVSAFP